MAEVYLGNATGAEGFARPVAIKRVLPAYSDNEQFSRMFIEEARVCSQLRHANIVSVSDFDRDESGRLMLVMELVEGKDLAALMATGTLPLPVAIYVVEQILRGLGYAHELPHEGSMRGIVHRDVSPHNVLLSWQGAVKVSDFGIAKAWQTSQATGTLTLKGKPSYMSPEQARGESLDGRSDLFAVGIMLFELITGQRLFGNGVSLEETLSRLFFQPIVSPKQYRPDCPDDLAQIAMLLLERDRVRRYPNARLVVNDLLLCRDASPRGADLLAQLMAERFADAPGPSPVAIGPAFSGAMAASGRSPGSANPTPWPSPQPAWQTPQAWQPAPDAAAVARMQAPTQTANPAQIPALPTLFARPSARQPPSAPGVSHAAAAPDAPPSTSPWKIWSVVMGSLALGSIIAVIMAKSETASHPTSPAPAAPPLQREPIQPSTTANLPAPTTQAAAALDTPLTTSAIAPAAAPNAGQDAALLGTPPTSSDEPMRHKGGEAPAKKAKGMLRVIARPPSDIAIGRRSYGSTPQNIALSPGTYQVTLHGGPNNSTKTFSVHIKSGATEEIDHKW